MVKEEQHRVQVSDAGREGAVVRTQEPLPDKRVSHGKERRTRFRDETQRDVEYFST